MARSKLPAHLQVQVGDVWKDRDRLREERRGVGRYVRVLFIERSRVGKAERAVVDNLETGRTSRVLLHRMLRRYEFVRRGP